jgi:hypothetical protein
MRISTSGWSTRISTHTHKTASASPAASRPISRGEPQPQSVALLSP